MGFCQGFVGVSEAVLSKAIFKDVDRDRRGIMLTKDVQTPKLR